MAQNDNKTTFPFPYSGDPEDYADIYNDDNYTGDSDDSEQDKSDTQYLFNTPEFMKPEPPKENTVSHTSKTVIPVSHDTSTEMYDPEKTDEAALMRSLKKPAKNVRTEAYKSIYDFRTDVIKNRGQRDLVDAVIETAVGYVSKNDKLDLCDWNILDTEKRSYKYVNIGQIVDFSRRDTTIRKAVFRQSFLNFIETGEMKFIPLTGVTLIEYIVEELYQSPDLLTSSSGYNRFTRMAKVQRKDGTWVNVSEYADTIRFSCTPDALRLKFKTLMSENPSGASTVVSYYKKHGVNLDFNEVAKDFSDYINLHCRKVCEGNMFGLVPEHICEKLSHLNQMLIHMESQGNFKVYTGQAGSGKAMPLDTIIPTPSGDRLLGDLKVGDIVFDRKGNMTRITDIFDHASKPCYEVTLSDGRITRCCDEHQWTCYVGNTHFKKMTLRLREIIDNGLRDHKGNPLFHLPMNECAHYTKKELPVHPYIVGAFLGCGYIDSETENDYLMFSTNEEEIVNRVAGLLKGKTLKMPKNLWIVTDENGRILTRTEVFSDLSEVNTVPRDRFIPRIYMNASKEQRIWLLKGFMDARGLVGNKYGYSITFYSDNEVLCNDVADLTQGLGFYTFRKEIQNKQTKKKASIVQGQRSYMMAFYVDEEDFEQCFTLQSKLQMMLDNRDLPLNDSEGDIAITRIRKLGDCPQRCIMVDNAEHLYLANSYIVTHNSTKAINECFPNRMAMEGRGSLLISLSTLVAINGADKALRLNKPTEPCSITMYNFCAHNQTRCSWVSGYDTYCIDEFSQWGLEQLDTFISIVERAYQENAMLVVLGDLGQIGSFLGRGNLLYMLVANYPQALEELGVCHRIDNEGILSLIDMVRNKQFRAFKSFDMDMTSLISYVHSVPNDSEMCITGSNSCAGLVNQLRMEAALKNHNDPKDRLPHFYVPSNNAEWNDYDMWKANDDWIRSHFRNKTICVRPKENFKFEKGAGKCLRDNYNLKFLRNEMCIATMVSEWTVRVVSRVFKVSDGSYKSADIAWGDFIQNFVPYYAITVNKAQGLEWDDVVVIYGDPSYLDDRQQKANYTPKKNYNLNSVDAAQATYVAISRPKQRLRIFCGNTKLTQQNKPYFSDHLEVLNPLPTLEK